MSKFEEAAVKQIVKEWHTLMRGNARMLGEVTKKAFLAKIVIERMDAQDDKTLPIGKFLALYEAAAVKLALDDV